MVFQTELDSNRATNVKDALGKSRKMAMPRYKQEMPPAGGYGTLDWARKLPKKMNGKCIW